MTIYQILCLLGFPSILLAVLKYVRGEIKKNKDDTQALKRGVQALLRNQMIKEYNHWSEKGFAPIYARENFENCWEQYHNLGANGVMDDMHRKFLQLPTPTEKKEEERK